MGTTADKLTYLHETKNAIRSAIEDKGVVVTDDTPFRQYAERIGDIIGSISGANAIYSESSVTVDDAGEIPIWPDGNLMNPTYGKGLYDKLHFALVYFSNPKIVLCCLPMGSQDYAQWFTSSYTIDNSSEAIRYTSPDVDAAAYWTVDKNGSSGLVGKSGILYLCKKE